MRTEEVIVLSYQESWKDNFEKIAQELRAVLGELATRIEHVGSTAVEGLAAKPIIDIDVVIAQETALSMVIEKLASIGYPEVSISIRWWTFMVSRADRT